MKILLVAGSITPKSARGKRWFYITKAFLAEGWEIHLVSFDPAIEQFASSYSKCHAYYRPQSWIFTAKRTFFKRLTSKLWTAFSIGGPQMLWFYQNFKFIRQIARVEHFDAIIGVGLPIACSALALEAARISKGSMLLFDIGDHWSFPGKKYNFNWVMRMRVAIIDHLFEAKIYSKAHYIVVHANVFKEHLVGLKLIDKNKCRLIPQISEFVITDENEPSNIHQKKSNFTFFYAGSFYKDHYDPKVFFESCKQLGNVQVILAGHHSNWDAPFIYKLGVIDQFQLLTWYSKGDGLLLIDNYYDFVVPSKLFEIILTNKPILYITYGNKAKHEITEILNKAGARFEIALQNDIDSISKAIIRLIEQSKEEKEFKIYTPSELGFETQEEGWIKLLKSSIHGE